MFAYIIKVKKILPLLLHVKNELINQFYYLILKENFHSETIE